MVAVVSAVLVVLVGGLLLFKAKSSGLDEELRLYEYEEQMYVLQASSPEPGKTRSLESSTTSALKTQG